MIGHILYVDDQALLTSALREFIEEETNRKVHYVRTPSEGIEYLEAHRDEIALVILDVAMPIGEDSEAKKHDPLGLRTGLDLAQKVRQKIKIGADIWFVTVRANDLREEDLIKAGVSRKHVYTKPVHLEDFVSDIKVHLNKPDVKIY